MSLATVYRQLDPHSVFSMVNEQVRRLPWIGDQE